MGREVEDERCANGLRFVIEKVNDMMRAPALVLINRKMVDKTALEACLVSSARHCQLLEAHGLALGPFRNARV